MTGHDSVTHIATPVILNAARPAARRLPQLPHAPVTDPHRLVTGHLHLTFLRAGQVWIATSDSARLYLRNSHRFDVALQCRRYDDGKWLLSDVRTGLGYLPEDGHPAVAPSHESAVAVTNAIRATLATHWTPELDADAAYADAVQNLDALHGRARTLLLELDRVDEDAAPYWEIVNARSPDPDPDPADPRTR